MRKISRKGLVKKLDMTFARYIKARDRQISPNCRFCLKNPIENCFHFVSRYFRSTRWDEENAIGSCTGCNLRMESDPYPFIQYFILKNGQDRWDDLRARAKKIAKQDDEDLKALILHFEMKLSQLLTAHKN